MEFAYTIQQMPDGKWRLTKGDVSMGVFETLQYAEAGMRRLIRPAVNYYDAQGKITGEKHGP